MGGTAVLDAAGARQSAGLKRPDRLRVAGHVSLGRRPEVVLQSLKAQGFSGAQIFASSPRTWRLPAHGPDDLGRVRCAGRERELDIFVHAIYLINLASGDENIYESSIRSLVWTLSTAEMLGADAVVCHLGSHTGAGFQAVRGLIARALERVFEATATETPLLIENSAGSGGNIGARLEEVATVLEDAGRPDRLGLCLDTAHAFAAGYDLRCPTGVEDLLGDVDRTTGLSRLRLMHVNDSKTVLGGRRDRHENLGAGEIGQEGFAYLVDRREISGLPLVLETPNLSHREVELQLLNAAFDGRGAAGEPSPR